MNIKNQLIIYWDKVKNLGADQSPKVNAMILLLNQMAFMGLLVSLAMTVLGFAIGLDLVYSIFSFLLSISALSVLILNAFRQFPIARFVVAGFLPFLISFFVVMIGGSFGEESILTVLLFLIYIFYREEKRKRFWFYVNLGTCYFLASIYLFSYSPILKKIDNPYDNFFSFLVCVSWLVMVLWSLQKKINRQQHKQKQLIDEMKVKNEDLQKTTEELEQFTYIASHDLKSPLRTIISFLDLIKRDVNRKKYDDLLLKLDFARSGAEQMNFLVTDILEYSKITSGKSKKKTMVSLRSVAEKVNFNLMEIIQERNVDLYVFPLPDFYCNETEMTVLFQNFIENGIKYNKESTPNIFVKSKVEDQCLTLQFVDNGIGIEEQYFEKIFLLFKRLHTSEVYKGTGLGLGLCKKIIDDMGGTVEVESTINVGTTFTIKFPIEISPDQAQAAKVSEVAYS